MSQRHKKFREKNGGLTPYMMWIITGYVMGYRVVHHDKHKRMYALVDRDGEVKKFVHCSAVNTLVSKGLMDLSPNRQYFILMPKGFDIAHDRIKKSNASVYTGARALPFVTNVPQQQKTAEIGNELFVG
jgi:hypothetical protein